MDGTHINCCPSAEEQHAARNHKGSVSQNCLACVSFDMKFVYFVSGWEGSAADATMYAHSHLSDLAIPPGKFYLADAGFGACDSLLVPYCGVCYHLAEWGQADTRYASTSCLSMCSVLINDHLSCRPQNHEEIFNLQHASAQNIVEQIFGVIKKHRRILTCSPPPVVYDNSSKSPTCSCHLI